MKPKLAQRIAAQMAEEIVRDGWRVGAHFGVETDLAARFGAGRWVIREAIAIAERNGLVETRRGRGGGLFVAGPAAGVISAKIRNHLEAMRISTDELIAARGVFEPFVAELAVQRVKPEQAERLAAGLRALRPRPTTAEDWRALGGSLLGRSVRAANNVVAEVFLQSLVQYTWNRLAGAEAHHYGRFAEETHFKRAAMAEAILGQDLGTALAAAGSIVALSHEALSAADQAPPTAADRPRNGVLQRKADHVADEIRADIVRHERPADWRLGSEAELMARYNVGRGVLREAIRSLEDLGVVTMRAGRGAGGLKVATPDSDAVARHVRAFLVRAGADEADVLLTQERIDLAASGLAARSPNRQAHANALRRAAAEPIALSGRAVGDRILRQYETMLEASGNPILQFFGLMLAGMYEFPRPSLPETDFQANLERVRGLWLVQADHVGAGEGAEARRAALNLRATLHDLAPRRRLAKDVLSEV
ncbi:MAG: FadR family transcriptional regulator [Caulobacteraceae bacterium]|nr:FadR family transcriptional regulator [Caulobacteraceae bacterium]